MTMVRITALFVGELNIECEQFTKGMCRKDLRSESVRVFLFFVSFL